MILGSSSANISSNNSLVASPRNSFILTLSVSIEDANSSDNLNLIVLISDKSPDINFNFFPSIQRTIDLLISSSRKRRFSSNAS